MVEDVIRGPPSRLAPLQLAGVHPVVVLVPWVDVLGDILESNGRLSASLQQLLKALANVHSWPRPLDVLHLGRVLGLQFERLAKSSMLCQLYLIGDAHDFALEVASLPYVLVARDMVSKRLERLEVAVANKTEENCLLSGFPVLVTEVLRDLPDISNQSFSFFKC